MMDIFDPISDDLSKYQVKTVLSPELWEKFNYRGINADYTKWEKGKMFDTTGNLHTDVNGIPSDCGGIYAYAIETPDIIPNCGIYLMYVGKASKTDTENLRARVKQYKKQAGSKHNRTRLYSLFSKWGKYIYVYYLPMDSANNDEIFELETRLIGAFGKPPCNKDVRSKAVKDAIDLMMS